jgi:hypothetical protein
VTNLPERKLITSQNARAQVLRQGGIPNAKKFQVGPPEDHPRWKGGFPRCLDCGAECSTYTSKHCGECTKRHRPKGDKHPLWKGGITDAHHKIRTSTEYKEWRMSVFQRDRFTCVNCGYRSRKAGNKPSDIRADHIKPFYLYPELRLAVDNGRTLCIPCDKILGFHYNRDGRKPN